MSQITARSIPTNLDSLLKRAAGRLLRVAAGWSLARALSVVLGAALAMLLLDAAFGFAAWVRIGLDALFVLLALGAAVYVVQVLRRFRYEPQRAAVLVEQRLGVEGSPLINAVHFASSAGPNQSPELVRASIERGDALARTLEPGRVADTAPLKRAVRNLAVVLAVMLIVFISAPGIYSAGIPRYLFPTDPNPAFTTLSFDVTIQPERVLFGHEATIHATVSGSNAPSQASIVFLDDEDRPARRAPMSRAAVGDDQPAERAALAAQSSFTLTIDRAEQSRRFYVETPSGRSKVYTLEVFPVPQFETVSVHYDYPAYTGWKSDTRALGADGIRVLQGTTATITVTSNIPLKGGELSYWDALDTGEELQPIGKGYRLVPRSDDPRLADVAVPITENGRFAIWLEAEDGTPSNNALEGAIIAVPDAKPDIRIADPPQTIVVPENHTVHVKIKADDDVGITRVMLTRSVNGWGTATIDLPVEPVSVDQAAMQATYAFELERLGVEAGDVITYLATAYDNRAEPNGPNQSADSALHVIQVISTEEYLEYERTKYRIDDLHEEFDDIMKELNELAELREQILEEMKPLLEKLQNGEELSAEDMKKLAELQKKLEEFEAQARELREKLEARAQMPELYEFEKPYTDMLEQLAQDLQQQEQRAAAARQAAAQLQQNPGQPNDPQDPQQQNQQNQQNQQQQNNQQQQQQQQNNQQQNQNNQQNPHQPSGGPSVRRNAQVRFEEFIGEQDGNGNEQSPFGEQMMKQLELTKEQLKQLELADRLMEQLDRLAAIIEAQRELEQRLATFENKEELNAAEQLRATELGGEQSELRRELVETMREMEAAAKDAQKLLPIMSASALEIVQKVEELAIVRDMKDATKLADAGEGRASHTAADSAADKLESLLSKCKNCKPGPGMGQIDGPLRLTPEQMQQALQQMAQGRGLPGVNPGQNQGPGRGMGGGGSRAPMAVRGPNARPDQGQQGRRNGRTGQASADGETEFNGETIDAGTATAREATGGYITGVPARYRDDAAAYLRRLADENQ